MLILCLCHAAAEVIKVAPSGLVLASNLLQTNDQSFRSKHSSCVGCLSSCHVFGWDDSNGKVPAKIPKLL